MVTAVAETHGYVTGRVRSVLRGEGLVVLLASLLSYRWVHGRWLVFAALFLVPDVSFAFYAISRSWATAAYNTAHSYILPIALVLWSYHHAALLPYALIWTAHIGFDRMLGYGLKYATAFEHTHLGAIGRARAL